MVWEERSEKGSYATRNATTVDRQCKASRMVGSSRNGPEEHDSFFRHNPQAIIFVMTKQDEAKPSDTNKGMVN